MSSFALTFSRPTVSPALTSAAPAANAACGLELSLAGELLPASSSQEDAAWLLRDLLAAAVTLAEGRATRALVPFHDAPWELCLVAGDGALLTSAYRTGPNPDVRVLDHPVTLSELVAQARAVLGGLAGIDDELAAHLRALVARLASSTRALVAPPRGAAELVQWRRRPRHGVADAAVATVFQVRVTAAPDGPRSESAHADLHALLVRGRAGFELRGRRVDLTPGYVFLHFERLVQLCRPLLDAWSARRPLNLRAQLGDGTIALRLGADGLLALTFQSPGAGTVTVPAVDPRAFGAAVLEGAFALCSTLTRSDRRLARNLRLRALRAEGRSLRRWLRGLERPAARVNDDPALYRALAATPAASAPAEPDIATLHRLRYTQRWRAEIEGIDLAGVLLCGDKLIVPGSRELHALDRVTGAAAWSVAVPRAATTLAGEGVLRLTQRGDVELRSADTGEALWSTRLAARVGAAVAHPVSAPGLPRLVIVAEGERRLVALDLRTGEARWAWTSRQGGAFKLRRVGKLLLVTTGDATVTALDLGSGEPVWRHADRGSFTAAPIVHGERCLALAGEAGRGPARVVALDAYTGALRWTADAEAPACGAPVVAGETAAVALAARDGVSLAGFDLATGAERFRVPLGALPGVYNARPAVLAFDDLVVASLPTGRVVAVDANTGSTRWTQTFRAPAADDVPRRLDLQLRAGALFVPQSTLAVLRPRDGFTLAQVDACDLVPDVLRVDEQCALYVAEESGHVGCYELGARLRVLRPA
jgi:outer membrane protein assembly factor BamB